MNPSPITPHQWKKVLQALLYSASSGFAGGFMMALAGVLQTNGSQDLAAAFETALVVGGVVGALNSLAVTVKQLFSASGK